jgi:hypothetical protein
MFAWRTISDIELRVELAKEYGLTAILTRIAWGLAKSLAVITMLLLPLEMVTTAVGGCLLALTFGLLTIPLTVIWLPLYGLLLGTSWLWLKAWYLRPILMLPGVLVSFVAGAFVMLAPEPERAAKWAKLAFAQEWPLSWLLLRPPDEYDILAQTQDVGPKELLFDFPTQDLRKPFQLDEEEMACIERETGHVAKGLRWAGGLALESGEDAELDFEKTYLACAALINLARTRVDRGDLRVAVSTAWKASFWRLDTAQRLSAALLVAEALARYGDAPQAKDWLRGARETAHEAGLQGEEWYKFVRPIRELLVSPPSGKP